MPITLLCIHGNHERRLDYKRWYAGHFHTVKETGKLRLMYQDYARLGE